MQKKFRLVVVWMLILLITLGLNTVTFGEDVQSKCTSIHVILSEGSAVSSVHVIYEGSPLSIPSSGDQFKISDEGSYVFESITEIHVIRMDGTEQIFKPASDYGHEANGSAIYNQGIAVAPQNRAPVAVDDTYTINKGDNFVLSAPGVLINDSDEDNNTLTAEMVSTTTNGALTLNSDGSFTYRPNADFTGIDTFTYKVYDGWLYSERNATVTINVLGENNPPVAIDDSLTANYGEPLTISALDLLVNDSEPDSDDISIDSINDEDLYGNLVSNENMDTLVYVLDNDTQEGLVTEDTFTYIISDGLEVSTPAAVTIQIRYKPIRPILESVVRNEDGTFTAYWGYLNENPAPVRARVSKFTGNSLGGTTQPPMFGFQPGRIRNAFSTIFDGTNLVWTLKGPDGSQRTATANGSAAGTPPTPPANTTPSAINDFYSINKNTTLTMSASDPNGILKNDSDPDGDTFTAERVTGEVKGPSHGTVTITTDGAFTYVPETDYVGTDFFTYKIIDSHGLSSNEAVVTITINDTVAPPVVHPNSAPSAINDSYSINKNITLVKSAIDADGILKNDSDPDGDLFTAARVTGEGKGPSHGNVELAADGTFTYVPETNYVGSDSFTYKIVDSHGLSSNEAVVTITINDTVTQPPVDNGSSTTTPPAVTPSTGTEVDIPDEEVPAGSTDTQTEEKKTEGTLPKTGGIPSVALYGLGGLVATVGILLKKKK